MMHFHIAGMFVGALFVGIHMATTHGVTLAMMSSYIPTTQVAGIGRISGTAWSLTDFIFGGCLLFMLFQLYQFPTCDNGLD